VLGLVPHAGPVVLTLLRTVLRAYPRSFTATRPWSEVANFVRFWFNVLVSQSPKPRRRRPPHNPGVRGLVEGKRKWVVPSTGESLKQGFRGWHERGYLPHRDEPGLTQFVTFRLADSFPESLRSEWEHLWNVEDDEQRRGELQAYLDKGRGNCYLRRSECGQLVEDALRCFHGERYDLRAWVVMPNHVHALFEVGTTPMGKIVQSWKRHTAGEINRILKRSGAFWEADYRDTFMRDDAHEMETRRHIENNPAKAGLVHDSEAWPCSSARLRDEFGRLRL
jgi:putative transposase